MVTFENTKTIYDLLTNAQEDFSQKVFVRYEKDDLIYEKSYRTFGTDAMAVAAWAQELSDELGHNVHAALIGNASYEYITTLVGVMAGGSVAVPMDRQLSKEGLADQINRADTDVVFYDIEFASQVEVLKSLCPEVKKFICLQKEKETENIIELCIKYRYKTVENRAREEELAVIIYTSGTTGRSKGVMLSQANLVDNIFCAVENPKLDVVLNVLPINHVFCLNGNILTVLAYGCTVCLTDDLSKFLHYMQIFQPSMIRLVPMMAKLLYNRYVITRKQNPEMSEEEAKASVFGHNLKCIAVGGAYLAESLAMNLHDLGFDIGQGYGMSECSPKISVPDYPRLEKISSVGYLVKGCEGRIVDGELQVKSPSVMMGYYNDPEKTAEALTEDGWLCTGDLAYIDEDNFVYLTGRKKNLIILSNGENVSPEQIENHFEDDLLIADILVYGAEETIQAEVYPNFEYAQVHQIKNIEEEVKAIIAKRNEELPTFAKIADVHIRKIPFEKTSSKKIIRPNYFVNKEETQKKSAKVKKPENATQQKIYDTIAGVLGDAVFGIDENLYQVGLDSFGSILLIEDLEKIFGKNINFTELLEHNTVEKLEEYFQTEEKKLDVDYTKREVYPLTNVMKYFAYIIKGNTTGNLPFAFELEKSVDLERLRNAILKVIDAHPGLRGILKPMENGYLGLYRDDNREVNIPIIHLTEEEWENSHEDLLVPFQYTEDDELIHISLYETERAKYMFFDVAHLMGDGISMNIIMEDLNKAYEGEELQQETDYSVYEFILEEQAREATGVRQATLKYFGELLDGVKLNRSILNNRVMGEYSVDRNKVIRKRFDKIVRNKILYYCQKHGVSENALFLTAFNYCISLFSNEDDIFSNSIHSGRTDSRWSRLVGPLFLTYYCRYTKTPHQRVEDLLKNTGLQIMETMKCSVATQRQGEMFFQFQGDILNVPEIGGGKAKWVHQKLDSLPFHLQVMYDDNGYYMELRYWENRFGRETVDVFLQCLEEIVAAIPEERSVRRLRKHISEEMFPKHFKITAGELEKAWARSGEEDWLLTGKDANEEMKVYILDENGLKKPYGAWGRLCIRDARPTNIVDTFESLYRPGIVYDTGAIARIMPDGSVDFLNEAGRTVLTEGMIGRTYYDLKLLKDTLVAQDGVEKADAYLVYNNENNAMKLIAELETSKDVDKEALKATVKAQCGDMLVPNEIR